MNFNFERIDHDGREFLSIGRLMLLADTPFSRIMELQNKIERVDSEYISVYDAKSLSRWNRIPEEFLDEIRVGGEKTFYYKELRVKRLTKEFFVAEHVSVLFNYNYNTNTNSTVDRNYETESYEDQCLELLCN